MSRSNRILESYAPLLDLARRVRLQTVKICHEVGPERRAHPGPALSIVDILVALYGEVMNANPKNPQWPDRDRFILSKGHACVSLYALLAELGYFPGSELSTLRCPGSILQGHPSMGRTPGIDMTTGSLGNGLGAAAGMAIGGKMDGKGYTVFVLLGDGELNEGVVWEACGTASKYALDNLVAIVDVNGFQSCGPCDLIMPPLDLEAKWKAFGWSVAKVDGHDLRALAISLRVAAIERKGRPKAVLARTVKGKGVSFMENNNNWHQRSLTDEEWAAARKELDQEGTG